MLLVRITVKNAYLVKQRVELGLARDADLSFLNLEILELGNYLWKNIFHSLQTTSQNNDSVTT